MIPFAGGSDRELTPEAEQRASTAEALREATVRFTRSLDPETVLATLLDCVRRLVPCDHAEVMLLGEPDRLTTNVVFDGRRVIPLPAGERPTLDAAEHAMLRDVLATGAAVMLPDVGAEGSWSLLAATAADASWMAVPLVARGVASGLVTLSRSAPGTFAAEDLRVVEVLAAEASLAVDNAVLSEEVKASKARLQTVSRRLVEAQERERRHIARELHDEAGQALASLRFGLRLLEKEAGEGEPVTARIAELLRTTDAVIDGLHRLAADLRPASLDYLGLEAALRQYTRAIASTYGLAVRFKSRGFAAERLPAAVETALFRVVQEAVTNVVRHARANRVDVLLEHRGARVLAMIEDDGIGFEPESAQSGERFGLLGLRERAEILDGSLTVESAPGSGTTVVVEVASADPYPDR
jgi:signal transduction histidine kinase